MKEIKTPSNFPSMGRTPSGKSASSLREALLIEETSRPSMPSDLNARLMQRVEKEVNSKPEKKRTRIVLPWIAAACVAGVIALFLIPHETTQSTNGGVEIAQKVTDSTKQKIYNNKEEESTTLIANAEKEIQSEPKVTNVKTQKVPDADNLLAKADEAIVTSHEEATAAENTIHNEIATKDDNPPAVQPQPRMLTERDIPITRPENYKYTKEEIALMKKQANEAYLKWVELELEISRYNLENTAENR